MTSKPALKRRRGYINASRVREASVAPSVRRSHPFVRRDTSGTISFQTSSLTFHDPTVCSRREVVVAVMKIFSGSLLAQGRSAPRRFAIRRVRIDKANVLAGTVVPPSTSELSTAAAAAAASPRRYSWILINVISTSSPKCRHLSPPHSGFKRLCLRVESYSSLKQAAGG